MMTARIYLGIASLSACNQSCDGLLQDFKEYSPDHKDNNDYTQKFAPVSVLSAVLPVMFIVVLTVYCIHRYVCDHVNCRTDKQYICLSVCLYQILYVSLHDLIAARILF